MKADKIEEKENPLYGQNMMQHLTGGNSVLFESGGEFVLPDYMPKVQKVLRVESHALPPSKYMSGSGAQFGGSVLHTMIYIGDEGEMSATVLPSKYDFSVPADISKKPEISTSVEVDQVNYRLGAPRKLNIRSRLHAKPNIFINEDISDSRKPEKINGLHTLEGELDYINTTFVTPLEVEVSDTIETNNNSSMRPIWCGAAAAVTDARQSSGGAAVRGDIYAKVLTTDDEGAKVYTKKIPFEEHIDCEMPKGACVSARADVISTEAGRENDSGNILFECVFTIEARIDEPRKANAVLDAFSESCEGKISYSKIKTEKLIYKRCGVFGTGASTPKNSAGAVDAISVLDTSGRAVVDDVKAEGGKITVSGRCMMNSIYFAAEGMTSGDYTVPYRLVFDSETPAGSMAFADATLCAVRTRLDGDDIVCDMDIFVCVYAVCEKEQETVSKMDFTAAAPLPKREYPLCIIYPRGESLWELAKKYHVSPDTIAKINRIEIPPSEYRDPDGLRGKHSIMLEFK